MAGLVQTNCAATPAPKAQLSGGKTGQSGSSERA